MTLDNQKDNQTPDNEPTGHCPRETVLQQQMACHLRPGDGTLVKPTRRGFLKVALGGLGLLWAGLATSPFLKYLSSGSADASATQVSSVTVGKTTDFPPGSAKNFQFGSIPALLICLPNGTYKAYNATCTHLGCTVQYNAGEKNIWCACHGGQYDAATGTNIAGPPPRPLDLLKAEVVNDAIVVSKA